MQHDANDRRDPVGRRPAVATAIPRLFARERERVLRILARWDASVEAQVLRPAGTQ